jgi:hypothetical protein
VEAVGISVVDLQGQWGGLRRGVDGHDAQGEGRRGDQAGEGMEDAHVRVFQRVEGKTGLYLLRLFE